MTQTPIIGFRQFLAKEMNNVKYDYSSTHINLPDDLSKAIIEWGKQNVPDDLIFQDPKDPSFGREDEIHVTVLYGFHISDPEPVRDFLEGERPFEIRLGKTSIFTTNPNFDVLKLEVHSPGIHKLNKKLSERFETTNSYPVYRPHITIAYIKKDKAARFVGDKTFNGQAFMAQDIIFSSTKGTKTKIFL